MTEPTEPRSLKRTIPPDLQKKVEEIQTKIPRTTGSPGDLDEEKKRWLIVGICLHSIISPLLRKYVYCIVSSLYRSLVDRNKIDTQRWNRYLWKFPDTNEYYLNYKSINNNYDNCKNDYHMYDYRVMSHVDLSKLFLQPNMTHYSAIDESCDASALLGMITNISLFPPAVQTVAKKIKSEIRNKWAHCDFKDWNAAKYEDSFNSMTQLVKNVGTSSTEEHKILGELNTWATNGKNLLSGLKLGIDIVDEIRQQTHVLSEYALTLRTVTEIERINLQTELNNLKNDLQERMSNVETKTNEHDETLNEHDERLHENGEILNEHGETLNEHVETLNEHGETLNEHDETLNEHGETLSNLKKEIKKQVEDHIPPHIRAQLVEEIREWEQDQTTFLETRATRHILESLPSHNCIVVTGSSGCGKSSNIHHAALHLRDNLEYEIIPVLTGPTDIMNYYNENKKQVFVVDDICGKETLNAQTLQMWRDYSEKMEKIFKVTKKDVARNNDKMVSKVRSPKLLVSCRLHIYKESQFQRIALFTKKVCNLLSPELCLLAAERMHMLHKYLPDDIINNIKQVTKNVDYFPLLCKLSKDKTSEEVKKLFTAPLISIKTNIISIINENKEQFCALVLCIVFNDGFDTDWLKLGSVSEKNNTKTDKLEHIVKEFDIDLSKERHRTSLKSGLSTLNGTYLKLRGTEYRMIHDKIYKMAAVICGQHLTECFIKYAPPEFIQYHFIFKSLTEIQEKDDSIVLLKDQEEDYFERLLCDLKEHVITSTFHNSQLISQTFRDKLISFLRRSDDVKTVLEKLDSEGCQINKNHDELEYKYTSLIESAFYTTSLIESATTGYFDIVYFLIVNVKCNVNNTDSAGSSPLYHASKRGHLAVAKFLLENNADVSKCNKYVMSPLYVACKEGHKDIVELLLQNNADVNQCDRFGHSPLYVACKGRHKDIVELLLKNKVNVNKNGVFRRSTLYVACKGGFTDIVELLLHNNADVNQCDKFRDSPLFVACKKGHKDIVELLLQNKSDVLQFNIYKESSLHMACEGGHTDIVEVLLQNNADVNQCNKRVESSLFIACRGGRTDTVELLLQNNADVNQCDREGNSPLYEACQRGHKGIAKLLLQNKADVNQVNRYCTCSLSEACRGGYTDTVELLLQNNADVNQCDINGASSLYAACARGHKDTVEMLLQYDANVSQCDKEGGSPLFEACRGNIDIVELLLQKKADVNQCNTFGMSPLCVACKGGYKYIAKLLIKYKADVLQCNINIESSLHMACEGGHKDTVELLLQNNADVNQCNMTGESPLFVACKGGYKYIAELLIQYKADVLQCNINIESSLHVASEGGHKDTVELLLQNNADVNQCNKTGESPLFVACKGGYKYIAELLIQYKADVLQCNINIESSLHVACEGGHIDTVDVLLQSSADVNQCNSRVESSLFIACTRGHTDTVELLLKNNADLSKCDFLGNSPLYVACTIGYADTAELLLKNNADVSKCNNEGESPLYVACKFRCKDTVKLLLQKNADVSQCEQQDGKSPLHIACELRIRDTLKPKGKSWDPNLPISVLRRYKYKLEDKYPGYYLHYEIVKLLLAWNADVSLCDKKGQTPLDYARKSQDTRIVKLLEKNHQIQASNLK